MRFAALGGKCASIAFALGLAGAIAACSGDDTVTGDTGGSGGTSMTDSGKGGGTGGDASPDRADAKVDAPGTGGADVTTDRGGGGSGGADVSTDTNGGGGVDASPDVVAEARPDVTPETSVVDQVAEARADAPPDAAVTPDASPDVVADVTPDRAPDAAPDTTPPVDANDGGATVDVAAEANDGGTTSFLPSELSGGWIGDNSPIATNDAGQLTWIASYPEGGAAVELLGTFGTPQNWSAFTQLAISVNIVSGAGSMATVQAFLHGGDAGQNLFSGEEQGIAVGDGADGQVTDGPHTFFFNLTDNGGVVRSSVTDVSIDITAIAGSPANTVIEVLSFELSNP